MSSRSFRVGSSAAEESDLWRAYRGPRAQSPGAKDTAARIAGNAIKACLLSPLSAVRGYVEQENVMDKSVYEARWLLGPVFVLWFGCVAVGVVFG